MPINPDDRSPEERSYKDDIPATVPNGVPDKSAKTYQDSFDEDDVQSAEVSNLSWSIHFQLRKASRELNRKGAPQSIVHAVWSGVKIVIEILKTWRRWF